AISSEHPTEGDTNWVRSPPFTHTLICRLPPRKSSTDWELYMHTCIHAVHLGSCQWSSLVRSATFGPPWRREVALELFFHVNPFQELQTHGAESLKDGEPREG